MATRMWLTGVILAFNLGCDRTPRPEPEAAKAPDLPEDIAKVTLAKPDPLMMSYDPATRVLSLYDLPEGVGRWMLYSPKNKLGEPVPVTHSFMNDVDLDAVAVFYTTASGQTSPRVTLREIVTVNVVHHGR